MPVKFGHAATSQIVLAPGSLSGFDWSTFTVACALKRNTNGIYEGIITTVNSGGTQIVETLISNVNLLGGYLQGFGGQYGTSTTGVTTSDGWVIVVISKTTGTNTLRLGKYVISTGTWTFEDSNAGLPNGSAVGSGGSFVFGGSAAAGDPPSADVAGWALWAGTQLTDDQARSLASSWAAWLNLGPSARWIPDRDTTSAPLIDLMGSGANETSRADTTVSTSSAPIGYGTPILTSVATPAAGTGTVTAQPCTLTLTPVAGTLSAGAATVVAQPCNLTLTPVAGTVTAGSVTKTAQIGTFTLTPVAGTISAGAATVAAQPCTLTLTPVAGVVSGGGTVTAQPCTLTLTPVAGTLTAGAATVFAQPCTLSLNGIAGVLSAGAVTKAAQVCTLTLTPVPGVVSGGGTVVAQPCTLTLTPIAGQVSGGAATVAAQACTLTLTAVPGAVSGESTFDPNPERVTVAQRTRATIALVTRTTVAR